MYCPSPEVDLPLLSARQRRQTLGGVPPTRSSDQEGTGATLGFIMDGVTNLRRWSVNNNRSFQYFQNPNYTTFETIIIEGDSLQIEVYKMMQFILMHSC